MKKKVFTIEIYSESNNQIKLKFPHRFLYVYLYAAKATNILSTANIFSILNTSKVVFRNSD